MIGKENTLFAVESFGEVNVDQLTLAFLSHAL